MESYYLEVASILDRASRKEANLRSLVYKSELKNKKKLLKLSCETAKNKSLLKELHVSVLNDSFAPGLRVKDPLEEFVLLVLLYEHIYGKGILLPKVVRSDERLQRFASEIRKNGDLIKEQFAQLEKSTEAKKSTQLQTVIPRYARVNTLKCSCTELVEYLNSSGWQTSHLDGKITRKEFRKALISQTERQIFRDPHIKDLLIFPRNADLHDFHPTLDGSLILQDKASCLSAFVLAPSPGAHVVDACAAPGMKTTHLAALMRNKGRIFAFDKSPERAYTLRQILQKSVVDVAQVRQADFLRLDVNDQKFAKVEFALVDPPCSGTGMAKRNVFDNILEEEPDPRRLRSLANLQVCSFSKGGNF